jgi:hypothetical protein
VWFSINGTGDLLKATIQHMNHTALAIFKGSDCDSLTCVESDTSERSVGSNHRTLEGLSSFWETEKDKLYFLYVYGAGDFQIAITEHTRPENDHPMNATELRIGDFAESSTEFATPGPGTIVCQRYVCHVDSTEIW